MRLVSEQTLPRRLIDIMSPYLHFDQLADLGCDTGLTLQLVSPETWSSFDLEIPADSDLFTLHNRWQGLAYQPPGEQLPLFIKSRNLPMIYAVWDQEHVSCVCDLRNADVQDDVMRVIRGIFEVLLLRAGYLKVHMGAVEIGGLGFGLCGNKGAGKSTFICRILECIEDSRFCSNDKTFLRYSRGEFSSVGVPQRVGIQPGTMSQYPELEKTSTFRNEFKTFFWMDELTGFFDRGITPGIVLSGMIVPHIDLNMNALAVSHLPEEQIDPILREGVYKFSDTVNPNWLISLLIEVDKYKPTLVSGIHDHIPSIPWVHIKGNPWIESFADVMDDLLTGIRQKTGMRKPGWRS